MSCRVLCSSLVLLLLCRSLMAGQSVSLAWDPNLEANLVGYKILYGPVSGGWNQTNNVGNVTNATIGNLPLSTEATFVTNKVFGTLRNDYTGFVGMRVLVGTNAISVTALGRIFVTGNSGTHIVKVVDSFTGNDVGSVFLSMVGGTAGEFKYATLPSPVTLAAGGTYYVVTQETLTGDFWYDYNTALITAPVGSVLSTIYAPATGGWAPYGTANQTFGPVDFKYVKAAKTFFVVVAYDPSGLESDPSNEVSWETPVSPPVTSQKPRIPANFRFLQAF